MNLKSKELFINLKDKDIPYWNPLYEFDEQDDDVKQFWVNEADKLMNGVTINGVYIHPWLYWHLNFWKMMLDKGNDRVPGLSELRDNEWFFTEILSQAEKENKGIFMFGTRRFGKALLNTEILYLEDREKRIGDIVVGDRIFDESGELTEVDGVYPQGYVKTYRVTFEDGRNIICCGEHLWKVYISNSWHVKTLNELSTIHMDMYIPVGNCLKYDTAKLPLPPSAYGSLMASYISGNDDDPIIGYVITRTFLRSSPSQKEDFINSFIRASKGIVTGEEEIPVYTRNGSVINFVLRMFWSSGWFAKLEKRKLVLSRNIKKIKISGIEIYGRYPATCITVVNKSHLFLTTNYVVTHNTAVMSSLVGRNATMTYNLVHTVAGSSREDLMSLGEYLEFGLDHVPPFLKINRTGNDWEKEVILGVKNVHNERDVHARIRISNIDQGKSSAALKTAGGTPYTTIYDEVGKFPFLGAYLQGLPAQMMQGRMRGMIIASGCVCAGTKVYVGKYVVKNIEDITCRDTVRGYNTSKDRILQLRIEWIKEPSMKLCYRVIAQREERTYILDCSYDHPFYCYNPEGRDTVFYDYVEAIRLREGDKVGVLYEGRIEKAKIVSLECIGMKIVYNVHTEFVNNYIANDFVTHNTGGNVERSQDAQKVMNDPASYNFIVMDYNLLNKHVVSPTWRIRKSGCFVPGQMSHAYKKDKTTLDKYLGIKNAPGLRKIDISVTDFEKSTQEIKEKREALAKKDKEIYVQTKMAYPLDPDDCFLNANINRFPVDDAQIHKNRLLEENRKGKAVDIYKVAGNKMGWSYSDKLIASYPFKGGNIDSPVIIYEDPPEEGGDLGDFVYTSGCLLPGEKVLTPNGLMNVEDVNMDDKLINMEGQPVSINALLRYDKIDEDIYTIKVGNTYSKTSFTGEHPLYVSSHKTRPDHRMDESLLNFEFRNVRDVKVGDWIKFPNVYANEGREEDFEIPFGHSVDLWWMIGFWLGNGYCAVERGYTFFYIDDKDEDTFNKLREIGKRVFECNVTFRHKKGCMEVGFGHPELAVWVNNTFGKYSYGKKVPEFVKYLPIKYKLAICLGYMDSDGCIAMNKKGYYSMEYVSVNLGMIEAFQDILTSMDVIGNVSLLMKKGVVWVMDRYSNVRDKYHLRIGNYGVFRFRDLVKKHLGISTYKLDKIGEDKAKSKRHRNECFMSEDGKYIYYRVSSIEKSKYTGLVYNFDCETHTYLCHNITTHNCDPFKQDTASTDSVGAFYVFKRHVKINDPFANKIVASYCSRPPKSDDFCRNCETLIEAYGAKCLMENADRIFELYLARRNKDVVLLEDGEKLANRIIRPGARQNNRLGLSPTVPNQRMLINEVLQYCWDEIIVGYDEDGNEIKEKGIYRIDDIELLEEIIAFGPHVNTDRIIAFGHALLLAKYYDDMNFTSKSLAQKQNDVIRQNRRREQIHGMTMRRHCPFKMR